MGGGKNSSDILIGQLICYRDKKPPYNYEFILTYFTVESWWRLVEQENNHIQDLALKILSIIPTNAGCERIFSILE